MGCAACQRVEWGSVTKDLDGVPSSLRTALDALVATSRRKHVYKVRYPYGELLVQKGMFRPPCGSNNCADCASLMEDVQYSHIPLALLVRKQVEVFIEYTPDENGFRFAPLRLINPGELFGVFEVLDHLIGTPAIKPSWSVSSGSRSVWVVAPLGNSDLTDELSTTAGADVTWDAQDDPQWKLIQQCALANKSDWYTEVLVFPKALLQSVDRSSPFFSELLSTGWKQSSTLRHSSLDDTDLRDAVNRAMRKSALPGGEMHHYNAVRHFLSIMGGAMPAYQSCHVLDQPAGPFEVFCTLLKDALLAMDRSRKYHPLVMQPRHLTAGEVGFYSCRCPSLPGSRLERPETYLRLTEAYRDVINSIK